MFKESNKINIIKFFQNVFTDWGKFVTGEHSAWYLLGTFILGLTVYHYNLLEWLIVIGIVYSAFKQVQKERDKVIEMEKKLIPSITWHIDQYFTQSIDNTQICLLHINNGNQKLENCQIQLSKDSAKQFICESFSLRPNETIIKPVFKAKALNQIESYIIPYNFKDNDNTIDERVSWILNGIDGNYEIKFLTDDSLAITMQIILSQDSNKKWNINTTSH